MKEQGFKGLCEGIGPLQEFDSVVCNPFRAVLLFENPFLVVKGKGDGGIRTHEGVTLGGFQDRCLKPLGHITVVCFILCLVKLGKFQGHSEQRKDHLMPSLSMIN